MKIASGKGPQNRKVSTPATTEFSPTANISAQNSQPIAMMYMSKRSRGKAFLTLKWCNAKIDREVASFYVAQRGAAVSDSHPAP